MHLTTEPLDLPLAHPFRISRGVQTHGYNVLLRPQTGQTKD